MTAIIFLFLGDGNILMKIKKFKREFRNGALTLISSSNALPFKWWKFQFLCFYCEKSFWDISELEYHNSIEHQVTETQIMDALMMIDSNQEIKLNFTNFACKLCTHVAKNYDSLKDHLSSNHKKKLDLKNQGIFPYQIKTEVFKCVLCPQSFSNYQLLNKHISIHFRNFVCDQCGVGFATEMRWKNHAQCHETGTYSCTLCDRVYNTISSLKDHVERVHMRIKKNKCPHCEETFRHYNTKIYHMVKAHGVKVPEYKCNLCPKVYLVSGKLRVHERNVHSNMSKSECDICQKKCIDLYALKDHRVTHTGEKNYECQVCKKMYSRKKTLATHMRIHNNDKRYVCQYCNKAFVQKCSLDGHLKSKHHHIEMIVESDDE